MPAQRVPGVPSAPRGRSRQPMASTMAPASKICTPVSRRDARSRGDRPSTDEHGGIASESRCPAPARTVNVPLGVFGAGQLLLEAVQAEAVMDALAQNAAGACAHVPAPADCRCPSSRAAMAAARPAGPAPITSTSTHCTAVVPAASCQSPPSALPGWCRPAGGCFPPHLVTSRHGDVQLLGEDLRHARAAEAALAAAHARTGAALDRRQCVRAPTGRRIAVADLRLGDGLTAAHHACRSRGSFCTDGLALLQSSWHRRAWARGWARAIQSAFFRQAAFPRRSDFTSISAMAGADVTGRDFQCPRFR